MGFDNHSKVQSFEEMADEQENTTVTETEEVTTESTSDNPTNNAE